jgi:radical SAM protein with 4Fe4S-binding SPASM domain
MCGAPALASPGDEARELTRDQMMKLVVELAQLGAKRLFLIGGEPFLRPDDMLAVTARAQQAGIKTIIITNGTLIGEDLARGIVGSGLHTLAVSVDGVGPAHDRVRGVSGAFARASEGMRRVIEEKRRRASRLPFVVIQCVISRLNYDQVDPLLRFKEETGADWPYFLYLTELPVERLEATRLEGEPMCSLRWAPKGESLLLSPAELSIFRAALERLPDNENTRLLKALDDDAYLRCERTPRRCYEMRLNLVINPYGEAYPCAHLDRCVTGDVRRLGVRAVWQNERHRKVVAGLRNGMYPVCSGCCFFRENLTPWQHARLWLLGRL